MVPEWSDTYIDWNGVVDKLLYKIRWKGGILAVEKPLDFDGNPDHATLGFRPGWVLALRLGK